MLKIDFIDRIKSHADSFHQHNVYRKGKKSEYGTYGEEDELSSQATLAI